jgi:16S rRNA (uracil1498-N3)-methyltransferase
MIASPAPDGPSLAEFAAGLQPGQDVTAFIGPEGGFTPEEVDLAAQAGCAVVSLGPRILRVETAAVALAACLLLR